MRARSWANVVAYTTATKGNMAFNLLLNLYELWTLVSEGNAAVQDEPSERQNFGSGFS